MSNWSHMCTCIEFYGVPMQHLSYGVGLVRMCAEYVIIAVLQVPVYPNGGQVRLAGAGGPRGAAATGRG